MLTIAGGIILAVLILAALFVGAAWLIEYWEEFLAIIWVALSIAGILALPFFMKLLRSLSSEGLVIVLTIGLTAATLVIIVWGARYYRARAE